MRPLTRREALLGSVALVASQAQASVGEDGFEVTQRDLYLEDLDPAHDGLRIAQLSDLHVGFETPERRVRAAIAQVNALRPDLVFLTGDFVTYSRKPIPLVGSQVAGLEAPVVAVLGNHDHIVDASAVKEVLEALGYATLRNQHTVLRPRGVPLTLIGIDDGGTRHDDVAAAFRGVDASTTRLVLTHNPITARRLPPDTGLACFSGHTHGGQVVIPSVTDALFRLAGQPYIRGEYRVNGNQLYVNRGLGFGRKHEFLHQGSEPEVALFILRPAREGWPDIGR